MFRSVSLLLFLSRRLNGFEMLCMLWMDGCGGDVKAAGEGADVRILLPR